MPLEIENEHPPPSRFRSSPLLPPSPILIHNTPSRNRHLEPIISHSRLLAPHHRPAQRSVVGNFLKARKRWYRGHVEDFGLEEDEHEGLEEPEGEEEGEEG